ncbi:uncharacterized protein LOC131075505 isoform X2 [Cryptomeria japonica]|uniref:uncharacterized protein LOC131075505 isoform X2 n=1 Tax=Cryptomeria japonica TaxID=3369 RepID=UPI0027DA5D24|nr:uncharacterized protein LOC131075505 isoform X2 [Cryptomeria japonica]
MLIIQFAALAKELQVGELIHGENFSLFEAMSALEIMDPKMDAGITTCGFHSLEEAIESNAAPISLSILETIDVMDHLLACEATWHKGHSLAQTVFSCLYLLDVERTSPNPLLHSYCRTVRATCELIRSAVSDSRTHEEEDFFTMAFGLVLKKEGDEKCLSMLNAVEETLSRQLRACKNSVAKKKLTEDFEPLQSDPELEEGYCKAVLCRLRFRKAFYHALTYMGKPQGRGLEMAHKHIRSGLLELEGIRESLIFLSSISGNSCKVEVDDSTTASGQMAVGFDDSINRRLLAPTPPRSIKILNWKMALDYFEKLLEDLDQICLMPLNLSMEEILQFTVDFQKSQPDLVARSRLQLLLVHDGKLFGRDLLSDVICRAINMTQLSNNQEFHKNYLVTQLGRLMLNLLRILCTNTAWQRRKLGKSLQEWGTLFHQLEVACNNQLESNSSSIEGKGLWMMQMMNWTGEQTCWIAARYLLLGFELELYSFSEYCMIYWYLDHVLLTLLQLSQERLTIEKDQQRLALAVDASKKKVKKKRGKEAEKEIHSPGILLQQACSYLGKGLAWMLAALTNDHRFVDRPTIFNTEQEIFIQNFELLQNSRVPEPLSYFQFKQSTMHANFLTQFRQMENCFEEALNVLKELRHCAPKGLKRFEEIRQMEHVAEKNRIALSVILAGKGDSLPRVSFEFSQHPCFPVAVIKRS